MPSTSVVINQVCTRGPNGALDEFVELRNISPVTQNIGSWQLVACNTDGTEVLLATIDAGTVMQPKGAASGQFFLVANADGYSAATPADQTYSGVAIQDLGGVKLINPNLPLLLQKVDGVGFSAGLQCTEGCPAELPTSNLCCHRDANGTDTDANCNDFRKLPRSPRNRFS